MRLYWWCSPLKYTASKIMYTMQSSDAAGGLLVPVIGRRDEKKWVRVHEGAVPTGTGHLAIPSNIPACSVNLC